MNPKVHQHPAARVRWLAGRDEYWTGPVRDPKALDCLLKTQTALGCVVWCYFDYASMTAADAVLEHASDKQDYVFGPNDKYVVQVARLRPVSESMGAGDAVGREAPAAASQDTPAPCFWSWCLWLIGAT